MKKHLFLFTMLFLSLCGYSANVTFVLNTEDGRPLFSSTDYNVVNGENLSLNEFQKKFPELVSGAESATTKALSLEEFLNLTPKKYRELTGEKLGVKKALQLKAAQKVMRANMPGAPSGDIEKGLYIVLAILGLGWVAMGIMDDWKESDWIVNLILTALCWLPGVIHAFVKMKKYY